MTFGHRGIKFAVFLVAKLSSNLGWFFIQNLQNFIGSEGGIAETDTGCIVDGVGDRREGSVDDQFTEALGSEGTGRLMGWDEDGGDIRDIPGAEYLVVGIVGVEHIALLIEDIPFGQGVTDAVDHAAQSLAPGGDRIDDGPAVNCLEII